MSLLAVILFGTYFLGALAAWFAADGVAGGSPAGRRALWPVALLWPLALAFMLLVAIVAAIDSVFDKLTDWLVQDSWP